jgi:hypothetical protein
MLEFPEMSIGRIERGIHPMNLITEGENSVMETKGESLSKREVTGLSIKDKGRETFIF